MDGVYATKQIKHNSVLCIVHGKVHIFAHDTDRDVLKIQKCMSSISRKNWLDLLLLTEANELSNTVRRREETVTH